MQFEKKEYLMQFGVLCSTFPLPGSVLMEESLQQLKCSDSHLPSFFSSTVYCLIFFIHFELSSVSLDQQ